MEAERRKYEFRTRHNSYIYVRDEPNHNHDKDMLTSPHDDRVTFFRRT